MPRGDDAVRTLRFAVVGSGIAGLGTAWLLQKQGHAVTVFEAEPRAGGHTHTVDVTLDGVTHPVDTGFLVFNDRTYPHLIRLFAELGVPSVASEMSFSVRDDGSGLEWAGTNLATLFARPANALSPAFWSMLADILRFNRETTAALAAGTLPETTLGAFLDARRYRRPFRDSYLVPMAAAIWSSPAREILDFPLPTFVRFCHNHGLLAIDDRPQWRTVQGGGRVYVQKIVEQLCRRPARLPGAAGTSSRGRRRDRLAGAARRTLRRRGARLPQRPGACRSSRTRPRTSAGCSARCATSATASCCTPMPRCCRAGSAPGRRGTTSPPTIPRAAGRCRCRTSSTGCSRCRSARRSSSR